MITTKTTVGSVAAALALLGAAAASAHPGGLDSSGGHHDRKNGGYHFHGGGGGGGGGGGSSALVPGIVAKPRDPAHNAAVRAATITAREKARTRARTTARTEAPTSDRRKLLSGTDRLGADTDDVELESAFRTRESVEHLEATAKSNPSPSPPASTSQVVDAESDAAWNRLSHLFTSQAGTTLRAVLKSTSGPKRDRTVTLERRDGTAVKIAQSRLVFEDIEFVEDWCHSRH